MESKKWLLKEYWMGGQYHSIDIKTDIESFDVSPLITIIDYENTTESWNDKMETAKTVVKCVNAHDELVKALEEVNNFLYILPTLRLCDKDGFDKCINLQSITELTKRVQDCLHKVTHITNEASL